MLDIELVWSNKWIVSDAVAVGSFYHEDACSHALPSRILRFCFNINMLILR